jgi:hypothetical protein
MDECLAARIVVRTDGLSLEAAMKRSFTEAQKHQRDFEQLPLMLTARSLGAKPAKSSSPPTTMVNK